MSQNPNPQVSSTVKYIIHPDSTLKGKIYLEKGKVPERILLKLRHDAIKKLHELFSIPIEIEKDMLRYKSVEVQYKGENKIVGLDTILVTIAEKNIDKLIFTYEDGVEAELEVSANDIEEAYKELIEKWTQEVDGKIEEEKKREALKKKLQEIISRHGIDSVINIPYYVTDDVRTIDELYDKLIHYLVDEIKNLKQKLEYVARENNELNDKIDELEEKLRILRDFITDNDLEDKFREWYKSKKEEEELEREVRDVLGYGEDEDYD